MTIDTENHSLKANDERQAIWARYNSMVIAVSIFFAGVGYSENIKPNWVPDLAGFLICILWLLIHTAGYRHFERHWKAVNFDKGHPYDLVWAASTFVIFCFGALFLFALFNRTGLS